MNTVKTVNPDTNENLSWAEMVLAISLGSAVPMVAAGIAITQALLGVALLASIYLIIREQKGRSLFLAELLNPLSGAMALMLLIWALLSIYSQDPIASIKVVGRMAVFMLAMLLVWAQLSVRPKMLELALKFMLMSAVVMLSISLVINFLPDYMARELLLINGKNISPGLLFKRFASAAMLMAPIIMLVGWIYRGRYLWISIFATAFIYVLIIVTHSRSGVVGIIAAALVVAILLAIARHHAAKWMMVVAGVVATIGISVAVWMRSLKGDMAQSLSVSYLPEWMIDPHRQVIWKFIMERFVERPFTGFGINTINLIPGADQIIPSIGGTYISSHPHNWIIEVLAETGVFGLFFMLVVLLILTRNIVITYIRDRAPSVMALAALGAAFLTSNLFNFSFWSSWWQLSFLSLFAMAAAYGYKSFDGNRKGRPIALITATEDWAFLRYRRPTALALRDAGAEVLVVANDNGQGGHIKADGFGFIPWGMDRGSMNIFKEWNALHRLARIYAGVQPQLVYNVALKPIIYGSICAVLCTRAKVVNLFSGLGVLFISSKPLMKILRGFVLFILRRIFQSKNTLLMVQDSDDRKMFHDEKVSSEEKTFLIPGSGIDLENFPETPEPAGVPVALVVARMLWDKGIGETIEAARILKERGVYIKLRLIGAPDPSNPASISESQLKAWHDEGIVEWLGPRTDIAAQLANSHIALLPSYREGMPRSLLEGAAIGRPLVAFDAPGCRDLVRNNENGILVPFKDAIALADALERLVGDAQLRRKMGKVARSDVETVYASSIVRARLKDIFLDTLNSGK